MKRTWKAAGTAAVFAMLLFAVLMIPGATKVQAKKKPVISQKTAYMAKKDTLQLKLKYARASKVKWSSSNKKVAAVTKKGLVKAKKIGKANIIAKYNGKKYTCKVTVEKKNINRARKLRDYVLKKGKTDKESGLIVLEKSKNDADTDGVTHTYSVAASKKNTKLIFQYICTTDFPYKDTALTMKIDLISGSSPIKKGPLEYSYVYEDSFIDEDYKGGIVTVAPKGEDSNIRLTKYSRLENNSAPEDEGMSMNFIRKSYDVEPGEFTEQQKTLIQRTKEAFKIWNDWFATIKELKKYNISMKTIGFDF